jgi:mRNA interferase RelE/StbE
MKYDIVIAQSAIDDLNALDARWRSALKQALQQFLSHEPKKESKSRIKRLRDLRKPQYRLRIHDIRVFYDVNDELHRVEILAFVFKPDTAEWLKLHGVKNEDTHDD